MSDCQMPFSHLTASFRHLGIIRTIFLLPGLNKNSVEKRYCCHVWLYIVQRLTLAAATKLCKAKFRNTILVIAKFLPKIALLLRIHISF
jgi:hypothetical protein